MPNLLEINERYYLGDFWKSWIGPVIDPKDPSAKRLMKEVERVFQSRNKVRECTLRHRRALSSRPYGWRFVDVDGEPTEQQELELLLKRLLGWMIPRSGTTEIEEGREDLCFPHAIAEAVHYRLLGGRGYLRLWYPARASKSPLERRIALHSPHPTTIEVKRDADQFPYQIRYSYQVESGETLVEVQELRDDGLTYFWTEDSGGNRSEESNLNLGGRFSVVELSGPPLITQSIRQQQDGINYTLTLWLRSQQYAGFLEDIITNGLPPGKFDDEGNFVPSDEGFQRGPGSVQRISGFPIFDPETGEITGYTQPGITTKQPVDVSSFDTTLQAQTAGIYEEFGQGHILSNDMQVSGVSRVQLRQDFVLTCQEDAAAIRVALADLYAAALLMVKPNAGEVRIEVQPRLAIAEPLPEEKAETRNDYEADLLSQHEAMSRNGVEDPEAMIEQIMEEKKTRLDMQQELGLSDLIDGANPNQGNSNQQSDEDGEQGGNSGNGSNSRQQA